MPDFVDFHITASRERSQHFARVLRVAGVRIQERVITEIGRPEYVIAVSKEDIERVDEILRQDIGEARVFTSDAEPGLSTGREGAPHTKGTDAQSQ